MKIKYVKGENPYAGILPAALSIEGEAEVRKQAIVDELLVLMESQGISRAELARRMDVQPSRVTSILSGANNFTINTLVEAARAVGSRVEIHFVPAAKSAGNPRAARPEAAKQATTRLAEDPIPYRAKRKPKG